MKTFTMLTAAALMVATPALAHKMPIVDKKDVKIETKLNDCKKINGKEICDAWNGVYEK